MAKIESTTDGSVGASEEADRRAAKEVESILGGNPVIDIPGLDEFVGTHESEYNFIFIECVKPLSYYRVAHLLRERDMLTPNLKLRSAVNSSCDLGR